VRACVSSSCRTVERCHFHWEYRGFVVVRGVGGVGCFVDGIDPQIFFGVRGCLCLGLLGVYAGLVLIRDRLLRFSGVILRAFRGMAASGEGV
jgi:hypothetical protein